jgi:hypothetical protein
MRIAKLVVLVAIVSVIFLAFAFAQESSDIQKHMMGKGMRSSKTGKLLMHNMMTNQMMQKYMVATKDGGVVVMIGNKLLKYDKNLNLVKEAEIKIDFEAIKKMMQKIEKKCLEYRKMSEEEEGEEETPETE